MNSLIDFKSILVFLNHYVHLNRIFLHFFIILHLLQFIKIFLVNLIMYFLLIKFFKNYLNLIKVHIYQFKPYQLNSIYQ
jgi:hypothetical protein